MNRYTWRTGVLEFVMVVFGIAMAFPMYIMINVSLRHQNDQTSPLIPSTDITFDNYIQAWGNAGLAAALGNSLFVTAVSGLILVMISAMAAYSLVRVLSRLSTVLFYAILIGLLLPFQIAMIPLYFTMRDLGLLGNLWSLILFYVGGQVSFSIFLYAGFIRALPTDYEEAAWLDGARVNRAFWSIVFPLLRPITWTVVILNAIYSWNDLLTPMLYLSGTKNVTVPVAILGFVDQYVTNWPMIFAGLVVGVAPILIAFFFLQRSVIKGFSSGLKG